MLVGAAEVVASRSSVTTGGDRCHAAADRWTERGHDEGRLVDFDDTPEEGGYRAGVRRALEEHAAELLHAGAGEERGGLVACADAPEEGGYRAGVRRALEEHAAELLHVGAGEETVDAA